MQHAHPLEAAPILGEMSSALRLKIAAIRALLARSNVDEVTTRSKIGRIILAIHADERRYGTRAVAQLATELGRDEATLYRYGQVASRWDERTLKGRLRRRNCFGEPLSWSHFVELASVEDPDRREQLLERALAEGLSVRALALAIRHAGAKDGLDDQGLPVASRLRRLIAVCESLKGRAHWDDTDLAIRSSGEMLSLIDRALSSQMELQEICARNLQRLQATRRRVAVDLSKPQGPHREAESAPSPRGARLLAGYARVS